MLAARLKSCAFNTNEGEGSYMFIMRHLRVYLSFVRARMLWASSCVTPIRDSLLMDTSWSPTCSRPSWNGTNRNNRCHVHVCQLHNYGIQKFIFPDNKITFWQSPPGINSWMNTIGPSARLAPPLMSSPRPVALATHINWMMLSLMTVQKNKIKSCCKLCPPYVSYFVNTRKHGTFAKFWFMLMKSETWKHVRADICFEGRWWREREYGCGWSDPLSDWGAGGFPIWRKMKTKPCRPTALNRVVRNAWKYAAETAKYKNQNTWHREDCLQPCDKWRGVVTQHKSLYWCTGVWLTVLCCTGVWCTGVWRTGVWCTGVWCTGTWCTSVWCTCVPCTAVWCTKVWCIGVWHIGVWCTGV